MNYLSLFISSLSLGLLVFRFLKQTLTPSGNMWLAIGVLAFAILALLLNQTKSAFVKYVVRFVVLTLLIVTSAQLLYRLWNYENFISKEIVMYGFATIFFIGSLMLQLTWIRLERSAKTKRVNTRLQEQKKQRPKKGELNLILGESVEQK